MIYVCIVKPVNKQLTTYSTDVGDIGMTSQKAVCWKCAPSETSFSGAWYTQITEHIENCERTTGRLLDLVLTISELFLECMALLGLMRIFCDSFLELFQERKMVSSDKARIGNNKIFR